MRELIRRLLLVVACVGAALSLVDGAAAEEQTRESAATAHKGPTTPAGAVRNGSAFQGSLLARLASVYTYYARFKPVPTVAVTVRGEMLQASGAASSNRVSPRYDDSHLLRVSRDVVATKSAGVCRNSFVAETHVLMADGTTKPIDEVEVGDMVLASDPETGRTEAREVVALITGEGEKNLVDVRVRTEGGVRTIVATRGHPFWVDDRGAWVDAGRLTIGDDLQVADGSTVEVVGVRAHSAFVKVHNLTVEGIHTYYVAAGGQPVLVHNQSSGTDVKGSGRQVRGNFPRTAGPGEILYRADGAGNVTNYQVYDSAGNPVKRVDLVGRSHGGVATPHVQEFETHVNPKTGESFVKQGKTARPALPDELPC